MLTYLHTLAYDDEGDAASIQHYMVNGMEAVTPQALPIKRTSLGAEEYLRVEEQLRHVKLMNNVAVYAVAQKYGIGELKELASAKFCELLRLKTSTHELPSLIDAVFGTTSVTDPRLRNATVEYCTQYSTEIVADNRVCISIRDHGELGLGMLQRMIEEKKEMSRQIKQLQGCERVCYWEVRSIKAHVWDLMSMADSINIPNRSGDASSHSLAKYSLNRLRKSIRTLVGAKDKEDPGLETGSPA